MKKITISQAEYDELLAQKQASLLQQKQIKEMQTQLDWLLEQLRLSKHKQYGRSSEQDRDFNQLSFFDEAEAYADPGEAEPSIQTIKAHTRKRKTGFKEQLPDDCPVEVIDYTLDDPHCPTCASAYETIGMDVRETIKIVPATVSIVREQAHRYVCRCCEAQTDAATIVEAPMPPALLARSIASAETVAHVMTQKFQLHLPLYRQEQDWASRGVPISRQTMSNWLLACSQRYIKPLIDVMHKRLCQTTVLHADETTIQVLREPEKDAAQKSYMWLYRTGIHEPAPLVIYDYQPDRRQKRPETFLRDFNGYLHVDGYVGYKALPDGITLVGCWAHARRKFEEACRVQPSKHRKTSLAYEGQRRCDALFGLEGNAKDLDDQARYQLRQTKAKPLVDAFFSWLKSLDAVGKTLFGQAVTYCLNQEQALRRYLDDGRLEISNNLAERSIKPFVIGRKNFLFANTPKGADASAWIFSLVETAKANAINPYDYLCWVLKHAPALDLETYPERAAGLLPECYPR